MNPDLIYLISLRTGAQPNLTLEARLGTARDKFLDPKPHIRALSVSISIYIEESISYYPLLIQVNRSFYKDMLRS